jgi:hypothetical protein
VRHIEIYLDSLEDDELPELEPQEVQTCVMCSELIGLEVEYGDNWGEGPLCRRCAGLADEEPESD